MATGTLTGQTPASTYKSLLKVGETANQELTSSLQTIEDGNGNNSALQLSTGGIKSTGTLAVDGTSTLTGNTTIGGTLGVTGTSTLSADAYIYGVRVGRGAGAISTNTAVGNSALNSVSTGGYNTASGYQALYSISTGVQNTATGMYALYYNSTSNFNTAIGYAALFNSTAGYNTASGYHSLNANSTGSDNTATGMYALRYCTTGSSNTATGSSAGSTLTTGSNNSFLGNNAQPSSATVSHEITLGNGSISALRCNAALSGLSDKRDKTDIKNLSEGINFVNQLNPVSFTWNTRDGAKVGIKASGFIAQELLELQNNSPIGKNLDLVYESNPEKLEARYGNLIPVLVKAIQELSAEIEILKSNQKG